MKTEHLKLYLSKGRPLDAVEEIQDKIILETKESLEGIKDPETLLSERKTLQRQKEQLQANLKRQKTSIIKTNKQRDAMLNKWLSFTAEITEASQKHGVDFREFPSHLAVGITFIQQLQNIRPDSFVHVGGLKIPQQKTESILDDDLIKLFEVEVKQNQLEEIIARKSKAMQELFSSDLE